MLCITHNTAYFNRMFLCPLGIFLFYQRGPRDEKQNICFLQEAAEIVFCQSCTKDGDDPAAAGEGERAPSVTGLQHYCFWAAFPLASQALCALPQLSVVPGAGRTKRCRGSPALLWTKAGSSPVLLGPLCRFRHVPLDPHWHKGRGRRTFAGSCFSGF